MSHLGLSSVIVASLFAVSLLRLFGAVIRRFRDPLRDLPGPGLARWTRLWYQRGLMSLQFEKTNLELHRELGSVIRIAPDMYSIDDPSAVKVIYGLGTIPFEKDEYYKGHTAPGEITLFTDRNNTHHAITRRKLGSTYSASNLIQYENFVDNCILLLLQRLHDISIDGKAFDIAKWFHYYAFDVIGEMTFSQRFGCLENGEDKYNLMGAVHESFSYGNQIGLYHWLHPYTWWFKNLTTSTGEKFLIGFIQKHILGHIASLEGKQDGPLDFVQRWLNVQENNPEKMSMREIQIGAGQNIGAGADTTGSTLTVILYYLCQNPEVVLKLREEIAEARKRGELSDTIKYQEAIKLPYLQAVIKEGMRIFPIIAMPLPRVVPKGGAIIAGHYFPGGNVVGINPFVAHRNKQVFGEDADQFRPERWLAEKDTIREMERYFMGWGMGSRSCIGKHIASMEMFKLLPVLFETFDIELENPGTELKNVNEFVNRIASLGCLINRRKV